MKTDQETKTATESPWFILSEKGAIIVADPEFGSWINLIEQLEVTAYSIHFWIGDLLNYGELEWGEDAYQGIRDLRRFQYQTMANDKWVCSRIEFSRRREKLSFGHHAAVASLDPKKQDVYLRYAEVYGLSIRKMEGRIAFDRGVLLPPGKPSRVDLETEVYRLRDGYGQILNIVFNSGLISRSGYSPGGKIYSAIRDKINELIGVENVE